MRSFMADVTSGSYAFLDADIRIIAARTMKRSLDFAIVSPLGVMG